CVVDSSRFFVHLWIGPRSNCYYFGNYYGSYASTFGFTPWCSWSYHHRHCYDPLWSWCHTHYRRQGIDYIGRCRGWHDHFDSHEHERPARTWKEQTRLIADAKLDPRKSQRVVAADLADVVKRDDLPIKLTKLDERQRESIVKVSEDMRKLNVERLKIEREARLARSGDGDGRGKSGDNKPADIKPGDNNVADIKPGTDKPDNKSGDSNPSDNKLADVNPVTDKPGDNKPAGNKPAGDKANVGRSGRLPRIDAARPGGDDKAVATKSDEVKPGEVKVEAAKPAGDKPEAGKTARVDALTGALSSKGGEGKRTARLKLPEQTDAIRNVTRNSRVARSRDSNPSGGLKETTINLPGQTSNRPGTLDLDRGNKPPKAGSSAGSVDLGPNTTGNRGNSGAGASAAASGNAVTGGPDVKPPKIDRAANTNTSPNNSARSLRSSDGPKIELPKNTSGGDAPKIESRSNRSTGFESRGSQPRIELPRSEAPRTSTPKIDGPKFDAPKIESRGNRSGDNTIRSTQPRINLPTSSGGSSGPKVEMRTSRSGGGGSSRIEAPRISAPKIEAPRPSPRIQTPRSSPSQSMQSRSSSRSESSRSRSSGNSGGSSSRSRSRDRD
ncbi:MAG: hypothetical protein L0211_24250, partial [Planctomycetaceae bacterium]|nr:hypothetical protein [Planctomycetaceae bacterium]